MNTEIKILENYQFVSHEFDLSRKNRLENDTLLCVKNSLGRKTLSTIKRQNVTKWELFKRFFGYGKLVDCHIVIKESCSRYVERGDGVEVRLRVIYMIHDFGLNLIDMKVLMPKQKFNKKKFI